jgi:hypothetical protein
LIGELLILNWDYLEIIFQSNLKRYFLQKKLHGIPKNHLVGWFFVVLAAAPFIGLRGGTLQHYVYYYTLCTSPPHPKDGELIRSEAL